MPSSRGAVCSPKTCCEAVSPSNQQRKPSAAVLLSSHMVFCIPPYSIFYLVDRGGSGDFLSSVAEWAFFSVNFMGKDPSALGPHTGEFLRDRLSYRGHFPPSPFPAPLVDSPSYIYSSSFLFSFPNLSPLIAPLVVWGVQPRCFPQAIGWLFKWLPRADVPVQFPPPQLPTAETFLCPREHIVLLLCVWSGEYEQEQENPTLMTIWQASFWAWVCSSSLCSHSSREQMF